MIEDKIKIANSGLIKAMEAMKENENSETRNVFVQELLNSKLIIPSIIKPEPVDGKVPKGAVMSFFSVKTANDESMLFLFTSAEELNKWAPAKGKHLILQNYQQFKTFVIGNNAQYDGLVIDPYGANVAIRRKLIETIDANLKPMTVKQEKIKVEQEGLQPAQYASPGLYAAFTEVMKRHVNIRAAWMMQAKREGDKMPTLVLVVNFEGNDQRSVFNMLARTANEFLGPGESIGMMRSTDRVAASYIRGVKPFYKKDLDIEEFKRRYASANEEKN